MIFAIITHVPHIKKENHYYAYAPYVREMNVWSNYVSELIIVAPIAAEPISAIDDIYEHKCIQFIPIGSFDVLDFKAILRTILKVPRISWHIFLAMKKADHIHLRCPGNVGLLGCIIQILFPHKPKTAKYAGNWDPKAKKSWSYKLQQWILSNTFLTRKIQVVVYGEWEGLSKNIKPFFTATYFEKDKIALGPSVLSGTIDFLFVGALVKGKHPLYAMQLIKKLHQKGYLVRLSIIGEGVQRQLLKDFIATHQLKAIITLKGNQTKETVQKAYQESHFVVLPSDSEGWPKVIAEGMFWGCVPIATKVSCVPFMLDYGNRGVLLEMDLNSDILQIETVLNNQNLFNSKQIAGTAWSRGFTIDSFEAEIKNILLGT